MASPESGEGRTLLAARDRRQGALRLVQQQRHPPGRELPQEDHEREASTCCCSGGAVPTTSRAAAPRSASRYRSLFTSVSYQDAQEIGEDVIQSFTDGEYSSVYLVYNQFVSVLTQTLCVEQVLPLTSDLGGEGQEEASAEGDGGDYLYEPSPGAILDALLPRVVIFQFYRALLESQAAEHGARMTAMDNATKNASELIDSLTLTYNRTRQAAITTELIEVVSGANALDG